MDQIDKITHKSRLFLNFKQKKLQLMTIYKPSPNLPPMTPHVEEVNWLLHTHGGVVFNPGFINKMDFCFQWINGSVFESAVRTRRYFREFPSITGVNFQAFSFEIENLQGDRKENSSLICLYLI